MNSCIIRDECNGFLSYLSSNSLGNEPIAKEELRSIYNKQYKPIMPKLINIAKPSYSEMLHNMRNLRMIRIRQASSCRKEKNSSDVIIEFVLNRNHKNDKEDSRSNPLQSITWWDTNSNRAETRPGCILCKVYCNNDKQLTDHMAGKKHKLNLTIFKLDMAKNLLATEKQGICVRSPRMLRYIEEKKCLEIQLNAKANKKPEFVLEVVNEGDVYLQLDDCLPICPDPILKLKYMQGIGIKPKGGICEILATYDTDQASWHKIPILFQFKFDNNTIFQILREISIEIETALTESTRPTQPFIKMGKEAKVAHDPLVFEPGLPLDKFDMQDDLERCISLEKYDVPHNLRILMERNFHTFVGITKAQQELLFEIKADKSPGALQKNYKRRFHNLLYLEEIQMEKDIRKYNIEKALMQVVKDKYHLLELEVPGLAESRPSILKGDKIYAKSKDNNYKEYEGIVHYVREKSIWVGFNSRFRSNFINGMEFDIRFTINRLPLKLHHRAVDFVEKFSLQNFILPDWKESPEATKNILNKKFRFFNRLIEGNPEQQTAVKSIVGRTSGGNPYLIYGPPGTGKTITLVESIKQILITDPSARILACAPSNSAADIIAFRLMDHVKKMFRMYAMSHHFSSVPDAIRDICNFDKINERYFFPNKKKLSDFRVIVTTLITAGRLVSANLSSSYFTHVFIDECGHAIEPEAMIPIAGILDCSPTSNSQVVLVGDPKQLGAIIRSPTFVKSKLEISLLERLMGMAPYKRITSDKNSTNEKSTDEKSTIEDYNPNVITKLICNYRSHPVLLKIPNELFYENELQACADEVIRNQLCNWNCLPNKGFPVIFHGVIGKDEREAKSPSFFNRFEMQIVVDYVFELLSFRGVNIKPQEIGIISPYRQQVHKLRLALKELGGENNKRKEMKNQDPTKITVGSTEEFQGQERKVIIISVVRSDPDLLQLDWKFKLGFVKSPKVQIHLSIL